MDVTSQKQRQTVFDAHCLCIADRKIRVQRQSLESIVDRAHYSQASLNPFTDFFWPVTRSMPLIGSHPRREQKARA